MSYPRRPVRAFVLVLATALFCAPTLAIERSALISALDTITTNELEGHVNVLADDTFEGREAGSRGGRAAERLPGATQRESPGADAPDRSVRSQ